MDELWSSGVCYQNSPWDFKIKAKYIPCVMQGHWVLKVRLNYSIGLLIWVPHRLSSEKTGETCSKFQKALSVRKEAIHLNLHQGLKDQIQHPLVTDFLHDQVSA